MFSPSAGEKQATSGEGAAIPAIGQGVSNLQTGANFFNTIMSGNRAATTALLQPDINRIREAQQGTLQGASTLMPRGGGRFATLFSTPFATNRAVTDLFSGLRSGAAGQLGNIGGMQTGLGTQAASNLFNQSLQQREMGNQMIGSILGAGLGLATTPFGGAGKTLLQRI